MLKAVGCCIIYLKRISMGDIVLDENGKAQINKEICIQCGSCQNVCPVEAIEIK